MLPKYACMRVQKGCKSSIGRLDQRESCYQCIKGLQLQHRYKRHTHTHSSRLCAKVYLYIVDCIQTIHVPVYHSCLTVGRNDSHSKKSLPPTEQLKSTCSLFAKKKMIMLPFALVWFETVTSKGSLEPRMTSKAMSLVACCRPSLPITRRL